MGLRRTAAALAAAAIGMGGAGAAHAGTPAEDAQAMVNALADFAYKAGACRDELDDEFNAYVQRLLKNASDVRPGDPPDLVRLMTTLRTTGTSYFQKGLEDPNRPRLDGDNCVRIVNESKAKFDVAFGTSKAP